MKKFAINEFYEFVSEPKRMRPEDQIVVQHADLPVVENELSVSLWLKLKSHASDYAIIFHKGTERLIRTPGLYLMPSTSRLHVRFTGNWDNNVGIEEIGDELLLNQKYHLTYTLSDPEKRLDFYINGEWVAFYSIENVKTHKVKFNDAPLYIGRFYREGFDGEISNFRYFNWRLSAEEAMKNYLNSRPFN